MSLILSSFAWSTRTDYLGKLVSNQIISIVLQFFHKVIKIFDAIKIIYQIEILAMWIVIFAAVLFMGDNFGDLVSHFVLRNVFWFACKYLLCHFAFQMQVLWQVLQHIF